MELQEFFPVWDKLSPEHQQKIRSSVVFHTVPKGTLLHNGSVDCTGPLILKSGQVRVYSLSDEGREVTLYRLFDRDICLFSASCMMPSIQFDVIIETEKETTLWLIPVHIYKSIMAESAALANYTNEIMASRFSDVMWLMEQIMWKSLDKRVAAFLLAEADIEDTDQLKITHETIANHLGSPREVITRMLRYFQSEGLVQLSRGTVELTHREKLETLCN